MGQMADQVHEQGASISADVEDLKKNADEAQNKVSERVQKLADSSAESLNNVEKMQQEAEKALNEIKAIQDQARDVGAEVIAANNAASEAREGASKMAASTGDVEKRAVGFRDQAAEALQNTQKMTQTVLDKVNAIKGFQNSVYKDVDEVSQVENAESQKMQEASAAKTQAVGAEKSA